MALTPGTRLGPYEVVALIGAGGMGEVYRAHDPRLGRDVAIKVLPTSFGSDPVRQRRFEQEARAIAALSHPNVLAIFDICTAAPPYIVTELLDGETLRAVLDRGALTPRRATDLGLQIATGLAALHSRGIAHRDLKPENVFLMRDGLVKLIDFGLAKTMTLTADQDVTRTPQTLDGTILGTIGYMAPEQVRGMPVDHRADLFALGALLYEMVVGERAFRGASQADTMSAVLREDPRNLAFDGAPPALARIVHRCLEKMPDDRFQTARDLRFALESIFGVELPTVTAAKTEEKSIAVLPFTDMSPLKDQAYFCEGMAEEIINALARVDGLRVAPRTSTFQCRERVTDLNEIARLLGVRTILEGSVRTAGRRLRVTAQLVDVGDVRAIWSDRFEGDISDVFAIQDEISTGIVGGLRGRLFGESVAPARRHTINVDAYHLYLRGRYHRFTTWRLTDALNAFEGAAALDPAYAPALAGIADAATNLTNYGFMSPASARPKVHDAVARALACDDRLAGVHIAHGRCYFYLDWNWVESLRSFERALALNPDESEAHAMLAMCYACRGDETRAARHGDHAIAIDPLSAFNHGAKGLCVLFSQRAPEAIGHCRTALELRPDSVFGHWAMGLALASAKQDGAVAALEEAVRLAGETDYLLCLLAVAHGVEGHSEQAKAIFERLECKAGGTWVSAAWRAMAACAINRTDRALDLISQACDDGEPMVMSAAFPLYDSLRGHPRFIEVVRRAGLPAVIGVPRP